MDHSIQEEGNGTDSISDPASKLVAGLEISPESSVSSFVSAKCVMTLALALNVSMYFCDIVIYSAPR